MSVFSFAAFNFVVRILSLHARDTLFSWGAIACLFAAVAGAPPAHAQITSFTPTCSNCHAANFGRINAVNAPAVIVAANSNHLMGLTFGSSAGQVDATAVAADLATLFGAAALTQTNPVNYQSAANSIAVTSLYIDNPSAVITNAALVGVNGGATGTVTVGAPTATNPVINYTHTASNCSNDTVTVMGTGSASTTNRTVTITVNPPTLTATSNSTAVAYNSGAFTTITLGAAGGPVSGAVITASPSVGTAQVVGSTIQYKASASAYASSVTISYRFTGPCSTQSNIATITLNVGLPPAPGGANMATQNVSFNSAQGIVLPVTGIFTQVNVTSAPTNGTAPTPAAGASTVTYTPNAGYIGADTFSYTVTGPGGTSGPFTVPISVIAPAPPTISNVTVNNVAYQTATAIPLTIGGVFTQVNVASGPAHGTAPTPAPNIASITYTPAAGYIGTDTITYSVTGPGGASVPATATISITVLAPSAPGAGNVNQNVAYQTATPVTVPVTGFFNQVTVLTGPANGTAPTPAANSSVITYTPNAGYIGADSFTYQATAPGGALSGIFTVTINVIAPAAPTAGNRAASVTFNTATPIDLASNVTGFFTTVAVVGGSVTHGTTSVAGSVVTFTPTAGYTGSATFNYTATGPGGTSVPGTVTITVSTVPPTATAAAMTVALNSSTTLDLAPFISGSAISGIAIAAVAAHGTATVNGTQVTYTPNSNYFGTDAFTYTAFGNAGTSAPATVSVTIIGRPDPSQDASVVGTINNQVDTARRFSQSQLTNYQRRMESLHRGGGGGTTGGGAPGPNAQASAGSAPAAPAPSTAAAPPRPFPDLTSATPLGDPQNTARLTPPVRLAGLAPPTDAANPATGTFGTLVPGLMTTLASAATSRSISLASIGGGSDTAGAGPGAISLWVGGDARFGTRDPTGGAGSTSFSTDGISIGADRRFSDKLVLGVGLGFARDKASIGSDGTQSRATGTSAALYGSYQPSRNTFVDALLGYGTVSLDAQRFVSPLGTYATSHRSGNQLFGSVSAGYEYRDQNLLISPYGRLDFTVNKLKQTSETGVGQFALTYFDQTDHTSRATLGVRAEASHETDWGVAKPRIRAEYLHGFQGGGSAQLAYADQIGGPSYNVNSNVTDRNSIAISVGSSLELRNGVNLGIDYQIMRSFAAETSQAVRFTVSKELDGKGSSASLLPNFDSTRPPLGLRVDAGYMYDRNVSRGRDSAEKLGDQSYTLELSKGWLFPVSTHTRAVLALSGGAEKFHSYEGLSRLYGGALGEFQYRTSGSFSAPTYALFARVTGEQFESYLRDGYRYTFGASVRKPVTDRITLFGAVAHNERHGQSAVFTGRDNSARFNIDYAATANSTLYLTTEYRKGDAISSGLPSLASLDIAKVFARDDAFNDQLFAYRLEASTVIGTIGYNLPFGPRDALDFSWRHVETTSSDSSVVYGKSRYRTDQLSLSYLLRF